MPSKQRTTTQVTTSPRDEKFETDVYEEGVGVTQPTRRGGSTVRVGAIFNGTKTD